MLNTSSLRRDLLIVLTATAFLSAPVHGQVTVAPAIIGPGLEDVCASEGLLVVTADAGCAGANTLVTQIAIGPVGNDIILDSTTGATFNLPANFDDNVQFSGLQAFSGTTTFNSTVTINNTVNTNGISNTGLITSGSLSSNTIFGNSATITNVLSANGSFTDSLTMVGSANVDMGGNQVHGVAAGTADTDAVNVAQLNAATSGITTDVTALETLTATHSAQIANLETTTATHSTQIAAAEAVNSTQSNQIAAVEAVNTTQASQITAIQAVNTTQSSQISALEAASASFASDIDTLFDLRSRDRRDMKQGVAAAMAMASAPMPSEPGRIAYAVNGATFRGEYAVGGSLTYRLPGDTPVAVNVGFSYAGNKNNGARIGIAGEF